MTRIAIAGVVLAGAILLDFGAIAQTGDTTSRPPGAAPTSPSPVRPVRRPMPQSKPPADASATQPPATQAPVDVANLSELDTPVAMTPKQAELLRKADLRKAELLRKAEQIDRKVMRSICIGC